MLFVPRAALEASGRLLPLWGGAGLGEAVRAPLFFFGIAAPCECFSSAGAYVLSVVCV